MIRNPKKQVLWGKDKAFRLRVSEDFWASFRGAGLSVRPCKSLIPLGFRIQGLGFRVQGTP